MFFRIANMKYYDIYILLSQNAMSVVAPRQSLITLQDYFHVFVKLNS